VYHCVEELLVDGAVDVEAFQIQADLSRVKEGECGDLGCDGGDIDIITDDSGVIASSSVVSEV